MPAKALNALSQKINQCQDAKKATALFRECLTEARQIIGDHFLQDALITTLVQDWSDFIDLLLRQAFKLYKLDASPSLCLIAVGGYGRRELFPASDIDILILTTNSANSHDHEKIGQFINLCWDIKLEVGHAVRSIAECHALFKKEITVATNLMEARLLAGEELLYHTLINTLDADQTWSSKAFFKAKLDEQEQRHAKFHNTAFNLEPNIKNSPGGLRDIHMIGWVSKRHFHAHDLHELVTHGFMTEDEYHAICNAQNLLWKIRFALHIITGRREDRLLFDYQKQLASLFGYQDKPSAIAIEQFMQHYFRTAKTIRELNELLLQSFREEIVEDQKNSLPQKINHHFQLINNYIETNHEKVFHENPTTLFELFILLIKNPHIRGVRASTIRQVHQVLPLINDAFRSNARNQQLFMQLLQQGEGVSAQLRRMNRYGILGRYLPVFANIIGRMQYDLFHVYTVDYHTLVVIHNIEKFLDPSSEKQFPLCHELIKNIKNIEYLYLAAMFHDIAKGRGGDHSQLGAQDARDFCQQHNIDQAGADLISFLVENHLLMSVTAQRRDIHDPDVIDEFCDKIKHQHFLDYLFLLTIADIRGTNEKLWNGWKHSILRDLYFIATQHLAKQPRKQIEVIRNKKQQALQQLMQQGFQEQQVLAIWFNLGNNYFLNNAVEEIVWQVSHVLNHADQAQPLILISNDIYKAATTIFVHAKDQDYLFATTVSVISKFNINIFEARIITSKDGYSYDSFQVLNFHDQKLTLADEVEALLTHLKQSLVKCRPVSIKRFRSTKLKHFSMPTKIQFNQPKNNNVTILEIFCLDKPGLLAKIGIAFVECGVKLKTAKIVTLGERAEDVFYISDNHDHAFTDPAQQEKLKKRLLALIQ